MCSSDLDRRNAFLLRFNQPQSPVVLLNLSYALKRGIEAAYQIEPSELAVELLPNEDDPRQILFYVNRPGKSGG